MKNVAAVFNGYSISKTKSIETCLPSCYYIHVTEMTCHNVAFKFTTLIKSHWHGSSTNEERSTCSTVQHTSNISIEANQFYLH